MEDYVLMTRRVSGLGRIYVRPYNWQMPLPSLRSILLNKMQYRNLIFHIGLNHKGLNWRIYKYQLNKDTYPVFLYSLAVCMLNVEPTRVYSWQIESNARRIKRFVDNSNIKLPVGTSPILNIGVRFTSWRKTKGDRSRVLEDALNKLIGTSF